MYHGWRNKATYEVAMFITSTPKVYRLAIACHDYNKLVEKLKRLGIYTTPSGVPFTDKAVLTTQLNCIWELREYTSSRRLREYTSSKKLRSKKVA
jgi:hypothetical protein